MDSWILLITYIVITGKWSQITAINDLCPALCQCEDDVLRVSCVFASLEVVPIQLNPDINHLNLSNNRISSLNLAFGFYNNLETLDLSQNSLSTIGSNNFIYQNSLIYLNVSNNNLQTIPKSALKGLTSLKVLDLSHNNITDMDPSVFYHVSELEVINLRNNSLISLPPNLLANLYSIKILQLSKNSLLDVPVSNLIQTPSLQDLDLSDNLIREIPTLPFLRSLTSLNLANNIIKNIVDHAFETIPALLVLNLQGNNLTFVPTTALSKLSVLSSLNLAENPLRTLDPLAFKNLFELKILDLHRCKIKTIYPKTFADNVNLEVIIFDGNHELERLPSRVLYMAKHLKIVSLKYCNLPSLEPTYFPLDSLTNLRIAGNPIVCNCSVHWLWSMIHTEGGQNMSKLNLDSHEIRCSNVEFHGRALMLLPESSLQCRFTILYIVFIVLGCLTLAVVVLLVFIYFSRKKYQKHEPFVPTERPQLLVYVDSMPESGRKGLGSYFSAKPKVRQDFCRTEQQQQTSQPENQMENQYETPYYGVSDCRRDFEVNSKGRSDFRVKNNVESFGNVSQLSDMSGRMAYRHDSANEFRLMHINHDYEDAFEYSRCSIPNRTFKPRGSGSREVVGNGGLQLSDAGVSLD